MKSDEEDRYAKLEASLTMALIHLRAVANSDLAGNQRAVALRSARRWLRAYDEVPEPPDHMVG